jgi:circadian clock protein KaiC
MSATTDGTTARTSTVRKIPTGVPGFDIISHGGIPEGRSTLLVGRSGTGKTILGLQLAANMARQGIKTVLVAVEESPEDLVTTGDILGLGLSTLIKEGGLRVTDASRPMEGPMVVTGDYDISGLTHRIEAIVKQTGAQALVLDSATALFSPRPPQELLRSLFFQLIHFLKRMKLTSVVLAEAAEDYGQLTTLGVEDYVCDVVVVLRNIIDGERRRRSIEINKYRRSAHYKGEYPCTITANGLTIFPLDAKDRPDQEQERYSSGFPGLDGMIDGGLFRDSIVIVRGPTGSGKTTLAGVYAKSGAERGERVAYYGFEEPRPILLRNFASLGMDMDAMVKSGNLQVHCRYPEAMGLEDLLVGLRLGLEEFKPSLVVMDSISSIEHSSSEKGFRQFMVGLASLLREHGRSALLTQTTFGADTVAHTAPYLSTIADTILNLDYSIDKYDLSRTLRVLKMRGSSHVTHPYRLEIGQGGLRVEPQALKPGSEGASGRAGDRGRRLEGVRVLLVEDFADARETVRIVLQREGAIVTDAASSAEAQAALQAGTFDVIVADIGLPEEDGLTFIQKVRAMPGAAGKIPAAALTAWGMDEDRDRAMKAGFQAYIVKPTDPAKLASVVAGLVGPGATTAG